MAVKSLPDGCVWVCEDCSLETYRDLRKTEHVVATNHSMRFERDD